MPSPTLSRSSPRLIANPPSLLLTSSNLFLYTVVINILFLKKEKKQKNTRTLQEGMKVIVNTNDDDRMTFRETQSRVEQIWINSDHSVIQLTRFVIRSVIRIIFSSAFRDPPSESISHYMDHRFQISNYRSQQKYRLGFLS